MENARDHVLRLERLLRTEHDLGLSKGAVGSTGRRNDALQLSRWCIEGERLPGSLVEPQRNCIELLLDRHARRNGLVKRPRKEPRPSADPDHVPANVRRAVYERDGGRCQFPVASGGVCGSTLRVELHHRTSRHRGGPPTPENLITLCGLHHNLETRREFGDAAIDGIMRRKRGRSSPKDTVRAASL